MWLKRHDLMNGIKKTEVKEFFTENSNDYQYFTSCPNIKRFLISLVLTVTFNKNTYPPVPMDLF